VESVEEYSRMFQDRKDVEDYRKIEENRRKNLQKMWKAKIKTQKERERNRKRKHVACV